MVNPNTDVLSDEDRYNKIKDDIDSVAGRFKEFRQIGYRNADFYANEQWTFQEKLSFGEQHRHPYVMNEIAHKIEHLVGTQMQTRTDSKIIPREPNDNIKAEIIQNVVKWVEQVNNIEIIESDVFLDGIIKGFGATVIRWDATDLFYGSPKIEKVPFDELYWDLGAKKADLSDAEWMSRIQYTTKAKAAEMFPEHAATIYESTGGTDFGGYGLYSDNYVGRTRTSNSGHRILDLNTTGRDDRQKVEIVEHYEKRLTHVYFVYDEYTGTHYKFSAAKDAEDYLAGLVAEYIKLGRSVMDDDGELLVRMFTRNVHRVYQTVLIGSKVIYSEMTSLTEFPFFVYFPYFDDGKFWAFLDCLIDPQRLLNRMIAQWDHAIGTSVKNGYTAIPGLLPGKIQDVAQQINKTGAFIPVHNHDAIRPMVAPPINPNLFQATDFAIGRMNDYAGGRNALGLQENAAESGKAVQERAQQGGLSRLPLFDRMRVWRRNMIQQIVWYIQQYMPTRQLVGIIGNSIVEIQPLDTDIVDTVREVEVNVIVDEMDNSASMKERNLFLMTQIIQMSGGQIPSEVWLPMLLEYTDMPENKKKEILTSIDREKAYMAMQNELASYKKLVEQVQVAELKKNMREAESQGMALDEQLKVNAEKQRELERSNARVEEEAQKQDEMYSKLLNQNSGE